MQDIVASNINFNDFLNLYHTSFSNNFYSLIYLKDRFDTFDIHEQDDNVYLYDNDMLLYFVNDLKKHTFKKCYTKVIAKNNQIMKKHDDFLKLNGFSMSDEYVYMSLDNVNIKHVEINIFSDDFDNKKVVDFLKKYFKNYTLDISSIYEKLNNKHCIIYTKDKNIFGVLMFSHSMFGVLVDYIAVDKSCGIKNLAYLLLCKLCSQTSKKINLFVDKNNIHAIKFYERFGFYKNKNIIMRYYQN